MLVQTNRAGDTDAAARLDEFAELAASAGATVVARVFARVDAPNARFLLGTGKVEELREIKLANEADLILVNDTLSPVQERNLEKFCECRVVGRTGLILDIFALRARSHEGKLQVELAQLKHMATRLVRGWSGLDSQRGGAIGLRGPGETKLELDRRYLRGRIQQLQERLDKVALQREQTRRSRQRNAIPTVSLVGYTNAGKSTLFNRITGAGVLAEDMLFATLDPTLRRMKLPHGRTVILSDTVGFISDLPTHLVAAFRATLEEVLEADLILHVRDLSDDDNQVQSADVMRILGDLGIGEAEGADRILEVWNKIDRLEPEAHDAIVQKASTAENVIAVSAKSGEGVDRLMDEISRRLSGVLTETAITLPVEKLALLPWLYNHAIVDNREDNEDGTVTLEVRLTETEAAELERRMGNGPKPQREDWE